MNEKGDPIEVWLTPRLIEKRTGNIVTQVHVDDYVNIRNLKTGAQQTWGYCPQCQANGIGGTWQPLSGFPKERVDEVQSQINKLRGFADGEGPKPPVVLEDGPTAKDQEAEPNDEDESEYYE